MELDLSEGKAKNKAGKEVKSRQAISWKEESFSKKEEC